MHVCQWFLLPSNHSSYLFSLTHSCNFCFFKVIFCTLLPSYCSLRSLISGFTHTLTLLLTRCKSLVLLLSVHLLTLLALPLWHSVLLHLLPLGFLPLLPLMIAFPKFQSLERPGTDSVTTTWKSVSSTSHFKIISVPDGYKHYLVVNCQCAFALKLGKQSVRPLNSKTERGSRNCHVGCNSCLPHL